MQKVKIFMSVESEVGGLEDSINSWIAETGARVQQVIGNIAPQTDPIGQQQSSSLTTGGTGQTLRFPPSDVMVIILYETN